MAGTMINQNVFRPMNGIQQIIFVFFISTIVLPVGFNMDHGSNGLKKHVPQLSLVFIVILLQAALLSAGALPRYQMAIILLTNNVLRPLMAHPFSDLLSTFLLPAVVPPQVIPLTIREQLQRVRSQIIFLGFVLIPHAQPIHDQK
jgi:hypothetical protein